MPQINIKKLSTDSPLKTGQYLTSRKHFFNSSKLFDAQITDVFDYLWPTVTALKNLRWQVNGYYHLSEAQTNEELSRMFVDPKDKSNRPNLYRICISDAWEEQERQVAKSLLINLIACFETWCEMILADLQVSKQKKEKFQFPVKCPSFVAGVCNPMSTVLKDSYYNVYKICNKESDYSHIDNYLTVFRYFKECRNALLHSTGVINSAVFNLYTQVNAFTATDLDVKEKPEVFGGNIGDPLNYSLRGVVGFAQILLKIVSVLDIELIQSKQAEQYYISHIKKTMKQRRYGKVGPQKVGKIVKEISSRHFFYGPQKTNNLYTFLQNNGIIGK